MARSNNRNLIFVPVNISYLNNPDNSISFARTRRRVIMKHFVDSIRNDDGILLNFILFPFRNNFFNDALLISWRKEDDPACLLHYLNPNTAKPGTNPKKGVHIRIPNRNDIRDTKSAFCLQGQKAICK